MRISSPTCFATLLIFAFAGSAWAFQEENADQRLERIKTSGKPVQISDFGKRVADEDNGAIPFQAALDSISAYEIALFEFDQNVLMMQVDDKLKKLSSELNAKHPKLFAQLKSAAESRSFQWKMKYQDVEPRDFLNDLMKQSSRFRSAIRILQFRTRILSASGESAEAVDSALAMMKLATHAENQPTLVCRMTGNTCRSMALSSLVEVLQQCDLDKSMHQAIENMLAEMEGDRFSRTLESERAYGLSIATRMSSKTKTAYLNYFDLQLANADKTFPEYQQVWKNMDKDARRQMLRHPLIANVEPSISMSRRSLSRVQGFARCVRIFNLIKLKKLERKNFATAQLGLAKDLLLDPLTGKPISVKPEKNGWRIEFSGGGIHPSEK